MNLRELIDKFRRETGDRTAPYRWDNDAVTEFINLAEDEACRRAGLLVDSSSELTQASVIAHDPVVELSEEVIHIRRAVLVSSGRVLVPRVARSMDDEVPGWETSQSSSPIVFIPDWETAKIHLWPPSRVNDELRLTVVRTPRRRLSSPEDTPEIARRYHQGLINWAKCLAYSDQDIDTFDPKAAEKCGALFTAEFGPPSAAIDEHWAAEQYYDIGERG